MKTKHTPAPWEWWTSCSWRRLRHSKGGHTTDVLMPVVHRDGWPDIVVTEADMALIAAAPELLEALRALSTFADTCELFVRKDHPGNADALRRRITAARAVIAKATGEEPA